MNIKPWIDSWVALQCCRISLWRILWGPRPKAMRSWEGNKLSVISGTDLPGNFLSLHLPWATAPFLLTINRQNVLQYFWWLHCALWLLTVLWLGLWVEWLNAGRGETLWWLTEDLSTAKTCWILIRFVLMGCGCLPSCWPLCKVFESNSQNFRKLNWANKFAVWTESKGVTRYSYCIQRGQLSVRG